MTSASTAANRGALGQTAGARAAGGSLVAWLDMGPAATAPHRVDRRFRHRVLSRQLRGGLSTISGSDVAHSSISEQGRASSSLAFRASLQPSVVGVNHLFTHRRELKVADVVVRSVAVQVVNREPIRNGANEVLGHESVDKNALWSSIPVFPESYPLGVVGVCFTREDARSAAPESRHAANVSVFVDLV